MRHSQAEKMEVIRLVEESAVSIRRTLTEFGIAAALFTSGTTGIVKTGMTVWLIAVRCCCTESSSFFNPAIIMLSVNSKLA